MTVTNLDDDDKITVMSGITTGSVNVKIVRNAKEFAAELIKTNYREGWSLKV